MKIAFRLSMFILIFSCGLFLSRINAAQQLEYPDIEPEISLDFKDADMRDILKLLSVQSGMNFVTAGPIKERKVTLYLDKVPLNEAMLKIFKANNLAYEFDRDANIFVVKDMGQVNGNDLVTRIFYLKYATVSSSSLREEQAAEISGSAGAASAEGLTTASGSASAGGEKGRWKVDDEAGITQAVRNILAKDSGGKPIGSVIEDFRTNSLIVSDLLLNMPMVAALVAALDKSAVQVMLEVEMLDVSKNVVDELGFDWRVSGITNMILSGKSTDNNRPLKLLNNSAAYNQLITGGSGGLAALSLTALLDYLRTQTDTKYLARPRLLTLDNETAEIKIATNEVVGEVCVASVTAGADPVCSAERTETGVMLRVTPQIDLQRGEIVMFITPKVVESFASSFVGQSGTKYRDPETRGTKSLVRVKDGETVIIGGLIRNQTTVIETKLPLLGDIPVLGALFRHKDKEKDIERELLIFITPRIMKETASNDIVRVAQQSSVPAREQGVIPAVGTRTVAINSSLNGFDTTGK